MPPYKIDNWIDCQLAPLCGPVARWHCRHYSPVLDSFRASSPQVWTQDCGKTAISNPLQLQSTPLLLKNVSSIEEHIQHMHTRDREIQTNLHHIKLLTWTASLFCLLPSNMACKHMHQMSSLFAIHIHVSSTGKRSECWHTVDWLGCGIENTIEQFGCSTISTALLLHFVQTCWVHQLFFITSGQRETYTWMLLFPIHPQSLSPPGIGLTAGMKWWDAHMHPTLWQYCMCARVEHSVKWSTRS